MLPEEFSDYLVNHGWERHEGADSLSAIAFTKKDLRLIVKGDAVDLFIEDPVADPWRRKYELLFSFIGWSGLGFFAWTLLMHIFDAVPLRAFLAKVKAEVTGGMSPMEDLMKHFRIAEADPKAIPLGY